MAFTRISGTGLAGAFALAIAFGATAASAETSVSIGFQQEPTTLDPTSDATAAIDGIITHNVLESLTVANESGEVLPALAESWTISDDGLTYRFNLRQGVTYHDGTAFDAEDVKFSFDRAMADDSENPTKGIFDPVESVTVIDPHTVEMVLKNPDAFFLFNIARGDASIVAPESVDQLKTAPIGTGAYRFDSWTRGDRLTLAKNPDYRDAADVAMDKVVIRFISDPAAASAALLSGELDAFPGFPAPEMLPQFEADPRFTVTMGSTEGEVILAMNNAKPPFDNVEVRRAISHAIDRAAIIDGAMYGRATPIGSFYPPHGPAYVDLLDTYPHDPDTARAMFEEAGVAGSTMTIRVPPFPYAMRSGEIIQAQLTAAGIDAKVENVEWGFWLDEIYKKQNYDMTIIAHTSPNDMGNFARGKSYFYGFEDPDFTDLWTAISTEADPDTRNDLLRQGQEYLTENAIHGFLFQLPRLGVYDARLRGYWTASPVLYEPRASMSWAE
ncbi:ABC transporter substrate-binding protein [Aquicoccus porphyridii]|uniref:ABC transporter substrate-binding protein n=1 Tax=Aquicoccus porphyridii TaxID=1852029 RepID=UPI00273DCA42|nr:ABC transporter substrate-binding protein [Aquicoccus porphyridii]